MNAPYRQVFTLDVKGPIVGATEIDFTAAGFRVAGNFDLQEDVELSWTAPEPIIEVPTGIGAVVVDGLGYVWVRHPMPIESIGGTVAWRSDNMGWIPDGQILDLLKAGAEIKSHGVEL